MEKPTVKLVGDDGNVFNLIGLAARALKKAGQPEQAEKMTNEVLASESYDEALSIIMDYCEVE